MIKTVRQLKDLIANQTKGDNLLSRSMLQYYFMERLLERISKSEYRDSFILKGGMLVTVLIGKTTRTTNDLDLTVQNIEMNEATLTIAFNEITKIVIEDAVELKIVSINKIMDDKEYGGYRIAIEGKMENMIIPFKVDISTGDKITPSAIKYTYDFMLGDKSIPIWSYNIETLLAEKMETIISRGVANTRMRDFYDIYILSKTHRKRIDTKGLKEAYINTCTYRETGSTPEESARVLIEVRDSEDIVKLWNSYCRKYKYADGITWEMVITEVIKMFTILEHN